jgi:DNA polymerase-1
VEILEYRAVKKLLSTYIDPFPHYVSPESGRIHTTFNQALTATGRLSSSKPNLQNIPIRTERGQNIRKAFISDREDGLIISADYSQIELRIMAHLCGDEHLCEAFLKNEDVHSATAAKIFGVDIQEVSAQQRRIAKTANFGIMYGISSFGLAQRLKIDRSQAQQIIADYFASFPAIAAYMDRVKKEAHENGYVETIFGRKRYLPDLRSHNANIRNFAERNAINAPIQGSSADIIKMAMVKVSNMLKEKGFRSKMILQIHDELLFDAYPEEVVELKKCIKEAMENIVQLSVPLVVECSEGKNWFEAH